jgi:hypothetical protein
MAKYACLGVTLPSGLSEPVVAGFTDVLVRARGGLPAA